MELEALEKLNIDLKEQGYKFSCVVWRSNYQVRGTFICEDGSTKRKRINLGIPAEITRLNEARKRITALQVALDQNKNVLPKLLPWQKKFTIESSQILVKKAKKLFIENWWENRSNFEWWKIYDADGELDSAASKARVKNATVAELKDKRSWSGISPYINKLDEIADAPLSVGALCRIAKSYAPNSRGRKEIVLRFKTLVNLCKGYDIGGSVDDLDNLRGKYSPKSKPNLTDDHLYRVIVELREKLPKWKWALGALYVWGVRPSEVFSLIPNEGDLYGTANVLGLKEEGEGFEERTALGCPTHLIEEFELMNVDRPYEFDNFGKSYSALRCKTLTDAWGRDLKRILDADDNLPSFTLYAIRHSYARRLIKRNLPSASCALSMGNDVRIFTETYLDAINRQDMAAIQKNL